MFSPGFVLFFYPRTFLRSRAFHDDEMKWFRKRQLLSVNKKCYRVQMGFAAKSRWGVNEL